MTQIDRRRLLALGAASLTLPAAIQRAWAIDAKSPTGTINDVKHVVVLMQENRSFDHYFGAMNGVRGFGDRFPIPGPGGATVWRQRHTKGEPAEIAPFPLNTVTNPALMRVEGTPHSWPDAQYAWDNGRMTHWPDHKHPHAMGYFTEADIPFQWALANAFTLCDAYHCSFTGGTNTNRLFLWSGTNDGQGTRGGPSISNSHDTLPEKGGAKVPYTWTTYPERLEAAGISWKIYEDMADNFGDNPLVGFKAFQDSLAKAPGSKPALAAKGLSTQHLDVLRADVLAGTLPSVSWLISPAKDSEHPGPSSPAQGADYIARVLDCLTANPDVWASTVLLVNFDENDGFFDHVPPPAPPSIVNGVTLGASTPDTSDEYHRHRADSEKTSERDDLMGCPYGLGPRVPMYVISPFARGGWVNSEVFDHTSVIRFLEKRFGVMEPNISGWRRSVCFDFKAPNAEVAALPDTLPAAERAATFTARATPATPSLITPPVQAVGPRRSRALPYRFVVMQMGDKFPVLHFINNGDAGVVFHVHDLMKPEAEPWRYTIGARNAFIEMYKPGPHDLVVYGPNGYYRRYSGSGENEILRVDEVFADGKPELSLGVWRGVAETDTLSATAPIYAGMLPDWSAKIPKGDGAAAVRQTWSLAKTHGWYDITLRSAADPRWSYRLAGRHETGQHGFSDPAMGGEAVMAWR